MGGIATAIKENEKQYAIKTDEGCEKDEFLITRHSQFIQPINVINCYGEIESRSCKKEIEERWHRLLEKIIRIEAAKEALILIGDLNKLIGNGEHGVKGNNDKVSHGGKLIHNLLSGGKYMLVNNSEKCTGGPFTRVDPADLSRLSCLDLVIISIDLAAFIDTLRIDKERVITPHRSIGKKKNLIYTDHFSMVFILKNLPMVKKKIQHEEKITVWNTNKSGGWDMYKELTKENKDLDKLADEDISNPTSFNTKLERIMNKLKFRSFGKVTFSNRCKFDKPIDKLYHEKRIFTSEKNEEKIREIEANISELLVIKQRQEYEKKLLDLKTLRESKGRSAANFKLKEKILGEKKEKQEAVAIEDPITEEMLFDPEKIKEASLNYLKTLLINREPKDEYAKDIEVMRILHNKRMNERNVDEEELSQKDFDSLVESLKKKNKLKYKFILNGGKSYRKCLYKLFKLIWWKEVKPSQWDYTIAHQLYKGKGVKSKLSHHRFIHTKNEEPKSFEHILMSKAKPNIIQGCSKFQMGPSPNTRARSIYLHSKV